MGQFISITFVVLVFLWSISNFYINVFSTVHVCNRCYIIIKYDLKQKLLYCKVNLPTRIKQW